MPVARNFVSANTAVAPVSANKTVGQPTNPTGEGNAEGDGEQDDNKTYCFCNGVSYGEMIGCDDMNCEIEWVCVDRHRLTSRGPIIDAYVHSSISRALVCRSRPTGLGIAKTALPRDGIRREQLGVGREEVVLVSRHDMRQIDSVSFVMTLSSSLSCKSPTYHLRIAFSSDFTRCISCICLRCIDYIRLGFLTLMHAVIHGIF